VGSFAYRNPVVSGILRLPELDCTRDPSLIGIRLYSIQTGRRARTLRLSDSIANRGSLIKNLSEYRQGKNRTYNQVPDKTPRLADYPYQRIIPISRLSRLAGYPNYRRGSCATACLGTVQSGSGKQKIPLSKQTKQTTPYDFLRDGPRSLIGYMTVCSKHSSKGGENGDNFNGQKDQDIGSPSGVVH
jgi:hypothetical protein